MTAKRTRNGDLHLDDLLPYLMNRLVARLNQNLGEDLRKRGFTFQDWRVLAVLASPGANEWVQQHAAGSGLSATSVRLNPRLLAALPLR